MEHTKCIDSGGKITETCVYKTTIAYVCTNTSFDRLHVELSSPQLLLQLKGGHK